MGTRRGLPSLRRITGGEREDSGQAIIYFALVLVPLIMVLALTVDLGIAYAERRQLQNVADSGAQAATKVIHARLLAHARTNASIVGMDAQVKAAIQDVASRASGGMGGFVVADCSGAVGGPTIQAKYVDYFGTVLGTVGSGFDSLNYRGVRLQPCKAVETSFARIMNVNDVEVGSVATVVFGVAEAIDINNPAFGPFAVWYGDVARLGITCNKLTFGCVTEDSTVIFRTNDWAECHLGVDGTVISKEACAAHLMDVNSNNFKGDINHGSEQVFNLNGDVQTFTTNGGNALGEYRETLDYRYHQHLYMLMPLIVKGEGLGSNIDLTTVGLACVELTSDPKPAPASGNFTAKIIDITDGNGFNSTSKDVSGSTCSDYLGHLQLGNSQLTSTSISDTKVLQ